MYQATAHNLHCSRCIVNHNTVQPSNTAFVLPNTNDDIQLRPDDANHIYSTLNDESVPSSETKVDHLYTALNISVSSRG